MRPTVEGETIALPVNDDGPRKGTAMSSGLRFVDAIVGRAIALRELPQLRDIALLAARIGLAWIFIYHGAGTLFGVFNGLGLHRMAIYFSSTAHLHPGTLFAVLNGITEFFGGIAVAVGLASRLAAMALVGDMVIAMITVAWANGIIGGPGGSGYEINLALCVLAVVIALLGPGRFALDAEVRALMTRRGSET